MKLAANSRRYFGFRKVVRDEGYRMTGKVGRRVRHRSWQAVTNPRRSLKKTHMLPFLESLNCYRLFIPSNRVSLGALIPQAFDLQACHILDVLSDPCSHTTSSNDTPWSPTRPPRPPSSPRLPCIFITSRCYLLPSSFSFLYSLSFFSFSAFRSLIPIPNVSSRTSSQFRTLHGQVIQDAFNGDEYGWSGATLLSSLSLSLQLSPEPADLPWKI